jgi:metal-sulfur cluster biosynthetic enzyme
VRLRLFHHQLFHCAQVHRHRAMSSDKSNPNPVVVAVAEHVRRAAPTAAERDEDAVDEFDQLEIFEMIRHINDPEHPLTLEQLNVAQLGNVFLDAPQQHVLVHFTPTIPHCSMATLIGLSIRVKLLRSLPRRFKVDVRITPGSHVSEAAINKQLQDKERVAAALGAQLFVMFRIENGVLCLGTFSIHCIVC